MFHDLFRFGFSGSHQRESLGPPSPASFSDGHPANRDRMGAVDSLRKRPMHAGSAHFSEGDFVAS